MDWKTISAEIKRQFLRDGLSLADAAARLGLSEKALYLRLSGRPISPAFAVSLSREFGYSEKYISTGEGSIIAGPGQKAVTVVKPKTETHGKPTSYTELLERSISEGRVSVTQEGIIVEVPPIELAELCRYLSNENKELKAQIEDLRASIRRREEGDFHSVADLTK